MTREETREAIKVMQHYADGGEVEQRLRDDDELDWFWNGSPTFDFLHYDYRIKKTTKKIKLYAWIDYKGQLCWITTDSWKRVQSEDKWVEVEE